MHKFFASPPDFSLHDSQLTRTLNLPVLMAFARWIGRKDPGRLGELKDGSLIQL